MSYPAMMLPMVALLVAQRQGGTQDAARAALLATTIKPPMAGLMLAVATSPQNTPRALPKPQVPPAQDGEVLTGGVRRELDEIHRRIDRIEKVMVDISKHSLGQSVFASAIPQQEWPPVSLFPNLVGLTRDQAMQAAREYGLNEPVFVDVGSRGTGIVLSQLPRAGAPWQADMRDVTLEID